jgi:hypothetical protein
MGVCFQIQAAKGCQTLNMKVSRGGAERGARRVALR